MLVSARDGTLGCLIACLICICCGQTKPDFWSYCETMHSPDGGDTLCQIRIAPDTVEIGIAYKSGESNLFGGRVKLIERNDTILFKLKHGRNFSVLFVPGVAIGKTYISKQVVDWTDLLGEAEAHESRKEIFTDTIQFQFKLMSKLRHQKDSIYVYLGQSIFLESGIQLFVYHQDQGILGISHFDCFNIENANCKECYPIESLGLYPLGVGFKIMKCDQEYFFAATLPSCL